MTFVGWKTWRLRPSDGMIWRAKSLFYQLCRGSSYKLTGTVIVSLACHRLRSITTVFDRYQLLYYDVHCCPPKYIYSPPKYIYNPPKYTVVHWSSLKYIGVRSYNDSVSQIPCRPHDSGNLFLRSYRVPCNLQVVPYEQSSFSSEKSILHVRLVFFASATLLKAEKSSRSLGRKASKLGK